METNEEIGILKHELSEARSLLAQAGVVPFARAHFFSHFPDIDRVRRMHTKMMASDFKAWHGSEGHRPYMQSADETCYLCTLLNEIAERDAKIAILETTGK